MRIGFLGGRFDPVHSGHLGAAHASREQYGLDRVIFVPAARVPGKADDWSAPAKDRLAMLHLALARQPRFELSEFELRQGGLSYTIQTLRHFRERFPGDELFWIVGEDQLARLPEWKDIETLAELAEFIVLVRPGHPQQETERLPHLRLHRCDGQPLAISSTEIRERVRGGRRLTGLVPAAVAAYISEHKLYR